MSWIFVVVIGCVMGSVLTTGRVCQPQRLEQRLGLIRSGLIAMAPLLLTLAVLSVVTTRVPAAPSELLTDVEVREQWFGALHESQVRSRIALGGLAFSVALLGVQLLVVLGDLRSFVSTHRLDLAARDEARLVEKP